VLLLSVIRKWSVRHYFNGAGFRRVYAILNMICILSAWEPAKANVLRMRETAFQSSHIFKIFPEGHASGPPYKFSAFRLEHTNVSITDTAQCRKLCFILRFDIMGGYISVQIRRHLNAKD
jgi:hypothetical protein